MVIGIDASRAFSLDRTGTEEYSYRVIMHLRRAIPSDIDVVLYLRDGRSPDFPLPSNWRFKVLKIPFLWTQVGLSWEMLFHPPDVIFVPAHAVPVIHPADTVVTIHGLEYERCPEAYRYYERRVLRFLTRLSCRYARRIIAVSESTRNDLIRLYSVSGDKIRVVHEGGPESSGDGIVGGDLPFAIRKPFFLFIGRLEKRKNVGRIIEAFDMFRKAHGTDCQLVLAGSPGFGYPQILEAKKVARFSEDIVLTGHISEEEKSALLAEAELFLFPSLCEGFGLPILEAQNAGIPVITSDVSSMPEVAGNGAIFVPPESASILAETMNRVVNDATLKSKIVGEGRLNVKRFSWEECSRGIAEELLRSGS